MADGNDKEEESVNEPPDSHPLSRFSQLFTSFLKRFSQESENTVEIPPRILVAGFLIIVGELFFARIIGARFTEWVVLFGHTLSAIGIACWWWAFFTIPSYRLILATTGTMVFNVWLVLKGFEGLHNISVITLENGKQIVFIIAVAIIAWLIISCYSLSLLKDSQLENGKE